MNASAVQPENIVLIGFMGCGKSTVGKDLHQRLGFPLMDMDRIIEARAGISIAEIFETEGEEAFRDMESGLLREFSMPGTPRSIISTGGGVVGREENRDLIRKMGYVVWLDAPIKLIFERTRRNRARPLLRTGDQLERIRTLMEIRRPLYDECCQLRLDTGDLDSGELATGILECARYFFSNPA